jgi:predicted AlkP superfamily pyrophosphatase or phosphodiesterase
MTRQFNVAEALQDELAVALQESLGLAFDEASRYAAPVVRYLQQQYGGDELYIPQPYMRRNVEEILAARNAGVPIIRILKDFSISRRTYYRLLSQSVDSL